ncbi:hypothetical protein BKA64DRAFT_735693 [Cadophora sp. MPI-SDFR-AT-0126]|nr:hypothetical protein BKA64DRAFT_735693 [Leotiomycetes sp. MPI-SDFR-AT-0126]
MNPFYFFIICLATTISGHCDRAFLKTATENYISAQTAGFTASSLSLASNFTYYENARAIDITNSTLSQPIHIDFTRSAHDTEQCATFTEIIAATNPHPYVIHTRMVFENHKTTLIESVVTDNPVQPANRDSRAVIQAVGDAYFDRFGNVSVSVPWGAPCYRLEGGLPARGEMVWPSTIHVPYRRYVVDEELGVVDIFVGFPGLDRTQGQDPMPDSHAFRVEGGKIKYLHTVSACVVEGCGLNGTFGM